MKICTKCQVPKSLNNFGKHKIGKDGHKSQCKSCDAQYRKDNKEKIAKQCKEWYENNREHTLARVKQYTIDNKEEIAKKSKIFYENNKERLLSESKQYRENNRSDILIKKKQYRENNKEKISNSLKLWNKNNKDTISLKSKQYRKDNKHQIYLTLKLWRENNKEYLISTRKKYSKTPIGVTIERNRRHRRRTATKSGDVTTQQLKELVESSTNCYYCKCDLSLTETHIDHYTPLSKGGLHTISNLVMACAKCNLSKGAKMPEEFILLQERLKS